MATAHAALRQLCRPDPVAFGHRAYRTRRWQLGAGLFVRALGTRGCRRDLTLRWLARLARPEVSQRHCVFSLSLRERVGVRGPVARGTKPLTLTLSRRERGKKGVGESTSAR